MYITNFDRASLANVHLQAIKSKFIAIFNKKKVGISFSLTGPELIMRLAPFRGTSSIWAVSDTLMLRLRETNHKKENTKWTWKPDLHVILISLMRFTGASAVYSLSETQKQNICAFSSTPEGITTVINPTFGRASTVLLSQKLASAQIPPSYNYNSTKECVKWRFSAKFMPHFDSSRCCFLRAPSRHARRAPAQHSSESERVTEHRWPQSP